MGLWGFFGLLSGVRQGLFFVTKSVNKILIILNYIFNFSFPTFCVFGVAFVAILNHKHQFFLKKYVFLNDNLKKLRFRNLYFIFALNKLHF